MNSNFKSFRCMVTCLLIVFSFSVVAQQNVRKLHNYPHEVIILPQQNKVSVSVDHGPGKMFEISGVHPNVKFRRSADRKIFMEMLQLSEAHKVSLSEQYKVPLTGLEDKLISRAVELKGLKLANDVSNIAAGDSNVTGDTMNTAVPEVLTSTNTGNDSAKIKPGYWLLIPALIAGLIIGFLFGRKKNVSGRDAAYATSVQEQTDNEEVSVAGKKQKSNRTSDELNKLQKKYELLFDETLDRKNFDTQYFSAVDQRIVAPFWEALNKGDEKRAVEYALKSMAHLTAITRMRLEIEQSFDRLNIDEIRGKTTAAGRTIDAYTNKDAIPDQIGTLIRILKQHELKGLGATNFQGYILNNLDA